MNGCHLGIDLQLGHGIGDMVVHRTLGALHPLARLARRQPLEGQPQASLSRGLSSDRDVAMARRTSGHMLMPTRPALRPRHGRAVGGG